ncbi:MAG: hypothetical protein U0175_02825 [Caldilineaceae bacterium]
MTNREQLKFDCKRGNLYDKTLQHINFVSQRTERDQHPQARANDTARPKPALGDGPTAVKDIEVNRISGLV